MGFQINEKFQVKAPIERVWSFLVDPQQVVHCMPGVKLTDVQDERNFLGAIGVKVGPVSMNFQGRVQITDLDSEEHCMRMTGEGREGGGWIRGSMFSRLSASSDTTTEVMVQTDLEIAGRAMQFGRSLIESIMKQQFQKFSECVCKTLESSS